MYDGDMQVRPPVPIYNTISLALSAQIAPVISGQITPEQAVDAARDAVMPEYQRLQTR